MTYLKTKRKNKLIDEGRRKEPPIRKPPNQIGEPNDECVKDVYKTKYFRIASWNQKNRRRRSQSGRRRKMKIHGQRFKDEENQVKTVSEEPSFKRGHFRGHKHPREPDVSKEEIEFKRTYRDAEATEAQGTDDAPITRQTRSQGLAPEQMLPTRPLEYKKYTKRK